MLNFQPQIYTCSYQQVLDMLIYVNKNLISQTFILLLTEIAVETNTQVNLDNYHSVYCRRVVGPLSPLPAFFLWCQMVGLIHNAAPSPSCPLALIPKLGGGNWMWSPDESSRSDCCFNWSLELRASLSVLHSKPRFSFQLPFLLPSSRGVLIRLPSAVRV